MPQLTIEEKKKVKEILSRKIDKALETNDLAVGVPFWKCLAFILDKYNSGSFYSTIKWKIEGPKVKNPSITEITSKVDMMYDDP